MVKQADGFSLTSSNLATGDDHVVLIAGPGNDLTNTRVLRRLVNSQFVDDFAIDFQHVRHTHGDYRRGQWRDGSASIIGIANNTVPLQNEVKNRHWRGGQTHTPAVVEHTEREGLRIDG